MAYPRRKIWQFSHMLLLGAAFCGLFTLGDQTGRTCDFYTSHAYPATYNLDLNVSCGSSAPIPGARDPVFAGGLGLQAPRDHPAGDIIVWVPESAHIWEPTIPHQIRHGVAEACEPRAYAEAVLAVALLTERRDTDSRFKHYIAALAQLTLPELGNIAVFANDHLRVLNVTRPDLVGNFRSVMGCIGAVQNSIESLLRVPASKAEQLWAYGVVRSRALQVRGRLALVPVLDLVNHARLPNVELTTLGAGGGAALRSLRAVSKGEEIVLSYGGAESNVGLISTHGFVTPQNPNGPLLPFDFNTVFQMRSRKGATEPQPLDPKEHALCEEVLRSPQLFRDAPLFLEPRPAKCLEDRLYRYYEHHYTEMDVLNQTEQVQLKALEVISKLCDQILQKYRRVSGTINRLQQHGQKVKDWLTLQVTHEAVEDMRLLESCVGAASELQAKAHARNRDDL